MVLKEEDQEEFIMAVSERLKDVKDSIPQIETSEEARSFVIGSLGTLAYMSKRLLSSDKLKEMNDAIEEQEMIIAKMIEKPEKLERLSLRSGK